MSRVSTILQRAGVNAKAALAKLRGAGGNLQNFSYFGGAYPMANLFRNGTGWRATVNGSASPFADANGNLTAVTSGSTAFFSVAFQLFSQVGYFPPGNYSVFDKGNGGGFITVDASSTGITSIVNATTANGVTTFTVADLGTNGDYSGLSLFLKFNNSSGSNATCLLPYCGLTSSIASDAAGNILDPLWSAGFSGLTHIKFSDWESINVQENQTTAYSQLNQKTNLTWGGGGPGLAPAGSAGVAIGGNTPYSVCAQVCKELGNIVHWLCLPTCYDGYPFAVSTTGNLWTTPSAHGWANNQQVAFYNYGIFPRTVSFSVASPTVVTDSNHPYAIGDALTFGAQLSTSATAPTGITYGTIYYVLAAGYSSSTYQVSLTPGGTAVNVTGAGTGSTIAFRGPAGFKFGTAYFVNVVSPTTFTLSATSGGAVLTILQNQSSHGYGGGYMIGSLRDPTALWTSILQEVYTANPRGFILPQISLEPWNSNYNQCLQLASILAGKPNDTGVALAYLTDKMWTIAESIFPRSQVIRTLENQNGSFGALQSGFLYAPTSGPRTGIQMFNSIDAASTASYPHQAYPTVFSGHSNQYYPLLQIADGAITWTDAQFQTTFVGPVTTGAGFDCGIEHFGQVNWRSTLDALKPNIPIVFYEGGLTEGLFAQYQNTATVTISQATPSVVSGFAWPSPYTDSGSVWRDGIPVQFQTTGALPSPLVVNQTYWVTAGSGTANTFTLSATQGGAAIATTTAGSGVHTASLQTDQLPLYYTRVAQFFASATGAATYDYYLTRILGPTGYNARSIALFTPEAGWKQSNSFSVFSAQQWSPNRALQLPQTASLTAIKNHSFSGAP